MKKTILILSLALAALTFSPAKSVKTAKTTAGICPPGANCRA